MKGFLRRILQSARGAEEPRLKPLTGSVYAGNRRQQEFQPGSWGEETVHVTAGPGAEPNSHQLSQPGISPTTPASAPAPLLPAGSDPRKAGAEGHEKNSEKLRPSFAADSPVASAAAPSDRENVIRPASYGSALPAPLPSLPALRPGTFPLLSASPRNEALRAEAAVPQGPQGISRAEKTQQPEEPRRAPSPLPQTVTPLLRPAREARPPSAGPQLSIPRNLRPQEPEIQVHIGRIEVIAAAPQPPRAPSPRPNRATSLADYLAGRNGRP